MLTGKRFRLRGEELVSSPIGTPQDAATDREQVLEALKGLAGPDGTDRIDQASQKYSQAQKEAMDALVRPNKFLVHGTMPQKKPKPSLRSAASAFPLGEHTAGRDYT